jgi:CDP-diacylglycerol--glycerol-3-phosphate 3-phosphatidyltransferase
VSVLARTSVTPNTLTVASLIVTIGAAVLVGTERFIAGALVLAFSSFFDMLDGGLARATGRATKFGAALDSTLDRVAEAAILVGLLVVFARQEALPEVVLTGVAMVGSFLVSYVRARAEGLGVECQVGVLTRPERIILLVLGLLLARFEYVLVAALALIALFSIITIGQRLHEIWKHTQA